MKVIPSERVKQRTVEQKVDVPVPFGEVTQLIPQARIPIGIAEQIIDLPVPQKLEQSVKLVKDIPHRPRETAHSGAKS